MQRIGLYLREYCFLINLIFLSDLLVSQVPTMGLPVGHSSAVWSAKFNKFGNHIISYSWDHTIKIWEASTGKVIHNLVGHQASIKDVQISSDEKKIISLDIAGNLIIWDYVTGENIKKYPLGISSFSLNNDGTRLVCIIKDLPIIPFVIDINNPSPPSIIGKGHEGEITNVLFGPNDYLFTISHRYDPPDKNGGEKTIYGDNTTKIWNSTTGELLQTINASALINQPVIISGDGKKVLFVRDNSIMLAWLSKDRKKLYNQKKFINIHRNIIRSACFSPDGNLFATASNDGTAIVFNANTGVVIKTLKGHEGVIRTVSFNHDGSKIITASDDNTAILWETSTGIPLRRLREHKHFLTSASFSNDGQKILTSSYDGSIKLWNGINGDFIQSFDGDLDNIFRSFIREDKSISLSQDGNIYIWSNYTGSLIKKIYSGVESIISADLDKKGKNLIIGSDSGIVLLWDLETKGSNQLKAKNSFVSTIKFSNDENYLAFGSNDKPIEQKPDLQNFNDNNQNKQFGVVEIWNFHTLQKRRQITANEEILRSINFSNDNKSIITAADDGQVKIWDIETGKLKTNIKAHNKIVTNAFFTNEDSIVITSSYDKSIKCWNAKTGKLIYATNGDGHKDVVTAMFADELHSILISGSLDNTVKFWNLNTGELIKTVNGFNSPIEHLDLDSVFNRLYITLSDYRTVVFDLTSFTKLYTRLQLESDDWLAFDQEFRYTGSTNGIKKLYLVCGLEIIELGQVKDSLYVPNLIHQKLIGKKEITLNKKVVSKLRDLNICNLTPLVKEVSAKGENKIRFEIIPRNGGLENLDLFINHNLTYTLDQSKLLKRRINGADHLFFDLSTDTIQKYLIGENGEQNDIYLRPKVNGAKIYGRGAGGTVTKIESGQASKFIGVFIGVNEYNPLGDVESDNYYPNLMYAENDAIAMSNAIEKCANTLFKDSVLIYRLSSKTNKKPSINELDSVFKEISKKSKAEDIIFLFFAGHGGIPEVMDNPNAEVRFILENSTKINPMGSSFGISEIKKWYNPQKLKAQRRIFILDACHSGRLIEDISNFKYRNDDKSACETKQFSLLNDYYGLQILAAAKTNESSYEVNQLKHGVMTYHLLNEIKETQQDTTLILNNWLEQSCYDVKYYLNRNISRFTANGKTSIQTPQLEGNGNYAIGVVSKTVKESIELAKVKTTIGKIDFSFRAKPGREIETVKQWIYDHLRQQSGLVKMGITVNEDASVVYSIDGNIDWGDRYVTYDLIKQGKKVKKKIEIDGFKSSDAHQISQEIAESIVKEILEIESR